MTDQLFPKPPRRMKQPRKDVLREQLAAASATIEHQQQEIERLTAALADVRTHGVQRGLPFNDIA